MNYEEITVCAGTEEISSEHAYETDIIVPDYQGDIERIVKCIIRPCVSETVYADSSAKITGSINATVFYLTPDASRLCCVTQTIPFFRTIPVTDNDKLHMRTEVKSDFFNIRAVSPRRIELRGALILTLCVTREKNTRLLSLCDDGVISDSETVGITRFIGSATDIAEMREVYELGEGDAAVRNLLCTFAKVSITETKQIANKVMVKGEVMLSVLYEPNTEPSGIGELKAQIPVSAVLTLPGVTEDSTVEVFSCITEAVSAAIVSEDGMVRSVSVDVSVLTTVFASERQEVTIIRDAFSPAYPCEIKREPLLLGTKLECVSDKVEGKLALEMPESIVSVLLCRAETENVSVREEENGICVVATLRGYAFGRTASDNIVFCENTQTVSFNSARSRKPGCSYSASAEMVDFSYLISGNTETDITAGLKLTLCVSEQDRREVVNEITLDTEHPRDRSEDSPLTLYFADEGEKVWDIARRYLVDCDLLRRENNLNDDVLPSQQMLTVPRSD